MDHVDCGVRLVASIIIHVGYCFLRLDDELMQNRINDLRTEAGLTQQELAEACAVSRQTINAIENDKYDPTLKLAFALADSLHTTVDELFRQ